MADAYDKIIASESAELAQMENRKTMKKERLKVIKALAPYKKGGTFVVEDRTNQRYVIRIPRALQTGQVKVTAPTEDEAFHKAYLMLCKEHTQTLREVYEMASAERKADRCLTDETTKRDDRFWQKWYDHAPLADRPITEITQRELVMFLRNCCGNCEIPRSTYTGIKCILNVIYDYAVAEEIVQINLARQIHHLQGVQFRPRKDATYTDNQRELVLRYIEDHHKWDDSIYYAAIYLMFFLCARFGEIKALRWTDYDPVERTIRIEREVVTRNGRQVEVNHTKSAEHGSRPQHLPDEAIALLNYLHETSTSPLIFPSETGKYLSTVTANKTLKRIADKIHTPYMSTHKIRFWSVSSMVRATEGNVAAVGRYAGQHNVQTTNRYIKFVQEQETLQPAAEVAYARRPLADHYNGTK